MLEGGCGSIMRETSSIHLIRRRALLGEQPLHSFADPDGIVALTPEKRRTQLENPLSAGDDDLVQIVGVRGERVGGRLDVIAGRLEVDGQPVPFVWASTLYVPPEFRQSLLGVTMVLKLQQLHDLIGVCGVSQMALPLYQKLKWRDFAMPRYILLRRSRAIVERYVKARMLVPPLRVLADAALAVQRSLSAVVRAVRTAGLRVEPMSRATPELDEALGSGQRGIATHRSAAFINWLLDNSFESDPRNRKGLFYVRARDGRLLAYFIAKSRFYETATHRGFKNLQLGSLQDFRIFEPGIISPQTLILLSVREISNWNPDAIEICLPPDCRDVPLRRWGFVPAGSLHLLVKCGRNDRLATAPESDWTIRPSDGDNFFS
ncbi:MAG: hypothetical protein JWN40_2761 [Phycisphaerales bacterium]|nr:hypothetical protein [Phycisphaerales bacterium]